MIILNGKRNNEKSIRELWDKCFPEDSKKWRDWYFENIYNIENVVGTNHNGELASMVHMNPYPIFMRGGKINAYALSGAATKESLRGQGFAGGLIKYSLNKAYKMGYDFSFLYPLKHSYYEKFGYSLGYTKYSYAQKYFEKNRAYKLKVHEQFDTEKFMRIYNKFLFKKNGFVIGDKEYIEKHIRECLCKNEKLVCFSIFNDFGYFSTDRNINKIEEMAYEGELSEAVKSIVKHYEKDIVFKKLYECDNLLGIEEKHCMGRVVSVEQIFKKLQCKDVDLKLGIGDDIIPNNNGVWHIKSKNKKTQIQKTNSKGDYYIDISALTPIITGLKIENDGRASAIQKLLFPDASPFIFGV